MFMFGWKNPGPVTRLIQDFLHTLDYIVNHPRNRETVYNSARQTQERFRPN